MPDLVLTFTEIPIPADMKRDHFLRGGASIVRYVATVRDGTLRVMVGKEPAGPGESLITHVSASVGRDCRFVTPPFRRPSDAELMAIKTGLFSLLKFEEINASDPCVRHLWEVPS